MNVYLKEKTAEEYGSYWQRFLCFCFGTMDLDLAQAADGGFKFMNDQRQSLEEACNYFLFHGHNDEDEDGTRRRTLLKLCVSFVRQDIYKVGVPAPVYFMGILGYRKNTGQWQEPANCTNILARTLWCMRALILEFSLPLNQRNELGKDKLLNPMDHVKNVWESECPFATLHSFMYYGFVVANQSVGEGKVRWSEDNQTMLFQGHMVSMDNSCWIYWRRWKKCWLRS
jgi:hypothetical protein